MNKIIMIDTTNELALIIASFRFSIPSNHQQLIETNSLLKESETEVDKRKEIRQQIKQKKSKVTQAETTLKELNSNEQVRIDIIQ